MTIFMGIKTKDYVFAAIDTRTTNSETINGVRKITGFDEYERKMYWLKDYNIGFATVGAVVRGPKLRLKRQGKQINLKDIELKGFRIGTYIVNAIDNYKGTLTHSEVFHKIIEMYKDQYAKRIRLGRQGSLIIFGYDSSVNKTFLCECASPSFSMQNIPDNYAFFRGAKEINYKKESLNVYTQLTQSGNIINLKEWAQKTFDSLPSNTAVNYPLIVNLYLNDGEKAYDIITKKSVEAQDSASKFYLKLNNLK